MGTLKASDTTLFTAVTQMIDVNRRELFNVLDSVDGPKTIIWGNKELMRRVNLFAGTSLLAEHGVQANIALYQNRPAATTQVLFFISPTVKAVDDLSSYMTKVPNEGSYNYVFFIPEMWFVARERLKENKEVFSRIESIRPLPLCWLPANGDVLTLDLPQLPSRLLLNGDWTYLHKCATALSQIDACFPQALPLFAKGKWATDVANMMERMRKQQDDSRRPACATLPSIGRIVIIDSFIHLTFLCFGWMDPLTPMLTQLTYAGLLDELYGIGMSGSIKVSRAAYDQEVNCSAEELTEVPLHDELFDRMKHVHINAFGHDMAEILQEIRQDEQFDKDKMSVAEYQVLIKKMPAIIKRKKLAGSHMRLAELAREVLYDQVAEVVTCQKELLETCDGDKVNTFIEDAIVGAQPLCLVIRLIAIQSICANGLKPPVLQQYDRMIFQSYGVEGLNRVLKCRKLGLIRERGGSKMSSSYLPMQFTNMKKTYKILVDTDEMAQNDVGYAYSGYSPCLVRVLEEGEQINWVGWHSVTGGPGIVQGKGTAVFVVGGVTRAEVAVMRLVPGIKMIMTSDVTNGDKIIDNITDIVD